MNVAVVVSLLFVAFQMVFGGPAETCSDEECKDACRCSSSKSPLPDLTLDEIPQLISLTFDEAVAQDVVENYWSELIFDLTNPDGGNIGATFFVPHEYTSYTTVNDLFNEGFEIGVHSITENPQAYWRSASEETLTQEFEGQKTIISKFANIPSDKIIGVRTPQLQLAGNLSIKAYTAAELQYDSSWPTTPSKPLFPYTLDYLSTQDCTLGNECPNEPFPGFWVLPINDLRNKHNGYCNTLASCDVDGTADDIAKWLSDEVDHIRQTSKIPLTLIVNSYWFNFTANSFDGLKQFLLGLKEKEDVFLVSQKQALDWMKTPVPLKEFKTEEPDNSANCVKVTCKLDKNGQTRYMDSCVACPDVYPWLGNPNGEKKKY